MAGDCAGAGERTPPCPGTAREHENGQPRNPPLRRSGRALPLLHGCRRATDRRIRLMESGAPGSWHRARQVCGDSRPPIRRHPCFMIPGSGSSAFGLCAPFRPHVLPEVPTRISLCGQPAAGGSLQTVRSSSDLQRIPAAVIASYMGEPPVRACPTSVPLSARDAKRRPTPVRTGAGRQRERGKKTLSRSGRGARGSSCPSGPWRASKPPCSGRGSRAPPWSWDSVPAGRRGAGWRRYRNSGPARGGGFPGCHRGGGGDGGHGFFLGHIGAPGGFAEGIGQVERLVHVQIVSHGRISSGQILLCFGSMSRMIRRQGLRSRAFRTY